MSVDTIDCYEIAKRVSAKTQVPVIPPLVYGCSQSHGNFPGTISIRPETMVRMICDIAEWLYKSNIRKILLLNGHMWNWPTTAPNRNPLPAENTMCSTAENTMCSTDKLLDIHHLPNLNLNKSSHSILAFCLFMHTVE